MMDFDPRPPALAYAAALAIVAGIFATGWIAGDLWRMM